ncbi:hypothetical protein N7532_010185 [Penicillium argentinense]|uniref:Xylanolytic transcriptional activator regulatory domain-containing protein n=1 Tax=Penicillium argentinense TaxID=1131581 RepID=A0A9W9EPA4_9EURO|nr:uncharacterized protein N7532_010185 [Penicillium argentinense]KAJ5085414.1 hypothetical protein N7532_010185 [Penicillium argentinense]
MALLPWDGPFGNTIKAPSFHTWPFVPDPKDSAVQRLVTDSHNEKARCENSVALQEIISVLRFLPTIKKLLHDYFLLIHTALVPKPIVLQLLDLVCTSLTESGYLGEESDFLINLYDTSRLAKQILYSSTFEVSVSPTMHVKDFSALFCGDNLRVETLGLLYTLAARASLYSSYNDESRDDKFIRELCWCSNSSLRLARELAPQTTDPIGDASLGVWRRLGDLATDLFALGLNREATYSSENIPFFLAEGRRKTFVRAYYLDKIFAMVFNRPPRISSRHADCKLPLDLSDYEIFAVTLKTIGDVKKNLTQDGWNTDRNYRAATWARLRYILGEFREETVEYQIRSTQPADAVKLRDLSGRCHRAWCSLPAHLLYNPACWTSDLPPAVCYMHGKVYLSYLHVHFQVYRLLCEMDSCSYPELLEVSANMLETVVLMANSRNRTFCSPRDLPGIILIYGLPSAVTLMAALEANMRDPSQTLPPSLKPSTVIRNLSVLVSQLESVSSPRETNHVYCLQASKAISRKLDSILDSSTVLAPKADISRPPMDDTSSSFCERLDYPSPAEDMDFDGVDLSELENLDFSAWVIDFDSVTGTSDWNAI